MYSVTYTQSLSADTSPLQALRPAKAGEASARSAAAARRVLVIFVLRPFNGYPFHWRSCSLVALAAVRDLLLCAKHLFVAAIADGDAACPSNANWGVGAVARGYRRREIWPRPGAGGRAWPGPQLAERIEHRPLFAPHV